MKNTKTITELFLCFLKIGAFTFGGGYAMIPLIYREAVNNKKWVSEDDVLEIVAIAESSPGPIAVNAATFIGYKTAGFFGAFFATLGVVMPSFIIITVIASLLTAFENLKVIKYAFWGIRAGILAMLLDALVRLFMQTEKDPPGYFIMAAALASAAFLHINVLYVIIGCAATGLIISLIYTGRNKR